MGVFDRKVEMNYDEQAHEVAMRGYRAHEPDLIADPHDWKELLSNPFAGLCAVCGEVRLQGGATIRQGVTGRLG